MSSWSYALTNKGRQLQAKAQAGVQLVYTRMGVGSGALSGQSLESMTALITPVKDLTISRLKRPAGATRALIGATLTNQDITTGFYLREVGIFATDPDDGEILYMYANAGATADYITPQGDGVIEKALNMNVFVGAAVNINANIDESLVYVTQQELADAISGIHIEDASTTKKGIVQLSNATNSTAEDRAATPKAVKSAYDAATAAQNTANAANGAAADAGTKADTAIAQLAEKADQSALTDHGNLTTAHGATSAATASRIVMRDSAGRAKIAAPSAADDIARKDTVDNAVGTLSSLLTTAKGNAVAAINELFTSASNGKTSIAAAITGKGVPASGSDTFPVLAQKIGQIVTGRRFASGPLPDMAANTGNIVVSGLGFVPRIVIVKFVYTHTYTLFIVNKNAEFFPGLRFDGALFTEPIGAFANFFENTSQGGGRLLSADASINTTTGVCTVSLYNNAPRSNISFYAYE